MNASLAAYFFTPLLVNGLYSSGTFPCFSFSSFSCSSSLAATSFLDLAFSFLWRTSALEILNGFSFRLLFHSGLSLAACSCYFTSSLLGGGFLSSRGWFFLIAKGAWTWAREAE